MADAGLISIIIPVYNTVQYINECVNSVANQSYKNLEIILVDDKSTDGSELIIDEWANKDNRIKVIHKNKNCGVSNSRNIGLECASGEYIMFVDSDDYISHTMAADLMLLKEETGAEIVKCGILVDFNSYKSENLQDVPFHEKLNFPDAFRYILGKLGERRACTYIWDALYPRESLFKANGDLIKMDEKLNYGEDANWLISVLLNCKSIAFSEKPLYVYRARRPGNTYTELNYSKSLKYSDSAIAAYLSISSMLSGVSRTASNHAYRKAVDHKISAIKFACIHHDKETLAKYSSGYIKMVFSYFSRCSAFDELAWTVKKMLSYIYYRFLLISRL